jgi:hypothetical protein
MVSPIILGLTIVGLILCKYKEKAQIFYKQLTFASWGWDASFSAGYIGCIETFQTEPWISLVARELHPQALKMFSSPQPH